MPTAPHLPSVPMPRHLLPSLQASGLRCERGERTLFEDFHFALEPGELVWLRGANGRGKTTLLRTLAGLGVAAAGELRVGGRLLRGLDTGWRWQLVYLGHANGLKDDLTAAESLHFAARLAGHGCTAAQVQAALDELGVGAIARRTVRTMSQGQRRRVALARLALASAALAPLPLLALLDEPFDALDEEGIARLARVLGLVVSAGGAVLFTSHQQIEQLRPPPRILTLPEPPPLRRRAAAQPAAAGGGASG